MHQNVFFEMEFILLVLFSVVIPVGIYAFLFRKFAVSRWTVVAFAVLLVVVSAVDVILLQFLAEKAKSSPSLVDDSLFLGQLSLALYLLPAAFAGLGVNLLSHVLVNHLNQAEREFDKEHEPVHGRHRIDLQQWLRSSGKMLNPPEPYVLVGSAVAVALIFAVDLATGAGIRLHVLYIFPLALVVRHCAQTSTAIVAFLVTTILQIITFSHANIALPAFLADAGVAISASLVVAYLARTSRKNYLWAVSQAATDSLTGLPNRRAFTLEMESRLVRQKRYGGSFSLAVLDLDGFKALNDLKGHPAGDEALKLMATTLLDCTRKSDSVCRLGGDEFAILFPHSPDGDCGFALDKLCTTIADRMSAAGFSITASIGCKTFVVPPESSTLALQQADQMMYEAKLRGKNCAASS